MLYTVMSMVGIVFLLFTAFSQTVSPLPARFGHGPFEPENAEDGASVSENAPADGKRRSP
jgi:hypothetical protein